MNIACGTTSERKIRAGIFLLMIAGFAGWFAYVPLSGPVYSPGKGMDFWLLALAGSFTFVAQNAVVVHTIPYLDGVGLPSTLAASVVAAMTLSSIVGRLGFGWVGDRCDKRRVLALLYALQVAGLASFTMISQPWHVIPFLILYAPAYGGAIPLRPATQGEYFGRRAFGAIQGLMMGCTSLAGMIGPIFAGWMFDVFGSYRLAFWVLTGVAACAIPAVLSLPRPRASAPREGIAAVPSGSA